MFTVLTILSSFVEFESAGDLRTAVQKLDGHELKGVNVTCTADVSRLHADLRSLLTAAASA